MLRISHFNFLFFSARAANTCLRGLASAPPSTTPKSQDPNEAVESKFFEKRNETQIYY